VSGASQLDIYNLALAHLDLGQRVASLTEASPQQAYCSLFYDRARKLVLEQCFWTFATRAVALTLLLDQVTLPASGIVYPGWRFIYAKPIDCLKMQAVTTQNGIRAQRSLSWFWNPAQTWGPYRPPWTEALDYVGTPPGMALDILTDQDSAWGIETIDPPNVGLWPETMIDCVSWQLSTLISGPASANQKAKEMALKMAALSLSRALAQNTNEQQPDPYPDSPSIQARL
jgi:hypothetical protein